MRSCIKPVYLDDYKEPAWYTRAWWWVDGTLIDPWWIPVRNVFRPHNVQRIRNTPRSWNDRSERIIHCVFSMLCDFVEGECGGEKAFRAQVEKHADPQDVELLALYDWYTKRDWKNDPFGKAAPDKHLPNDEENDKAWKVYFRAEDAFDDEQTEMAIRALKTRGWWWT